MSLEAELPGQTNTWEGWQMICCRYYTAGRYIEGKRVLEVGCGSGMGLGYLNARASKVVGGDYSPENIQRAAGHYGDRIELLVLDGQDMPFEDGSFDIALAMEVIYYFTSVERFLDECHRVLAEGGILCVCMSNKDIPGFHTSPLSRCYYSVPELAGLLKNHHFVPEFYGAFPISRPPVLQRLRSAVLVNIGRMLDAIPGGKPVKEFLRKIIYRKMIINKAEIEESDMVPECYHLEPLPQEVPDDKHQIVYVVAKAE